MRDELESTGQIAQGKSVAEINDEVVGNKKGNSVVVGKAIGRVEKERELREEWFGGTVERIYEVLRQELTPEQRRELVALLLAD